MTVDDMYPGKKVRDRETGTVAVVKRVRAGLFHGSVDIVYMTGLLSGYCEERVKPSRLEPLDKWD